MDTKTYPVPAAWAKRAFVDNREYERMYAASISDPDAFWGGARQAP
ncbi:MAG: hypothetical protein Q9M45_03350 [Robiginitomaculum sp.]|nr:hypothetical protein [Robiginitomaculum sp.]